MRTGAIFARGSCRALKWMLVLGALSVLGSAQAAAQAPTVEEAKYDSATSRSVTVTMSEEVWVALGVGENEQDLSGDFALVGGNTGALALADAGAVHPIAVDDIPSDRYPGTTTFTLRFAQAVSELTKATTAVAAPTQLRLVYTPDTDRPIQATDDNTAFAAITAADPFASPQVPVIGPDDDSVLTLTLTPAAKRALEEPRMRGTALATAGLVLPAATGPLGVTLTYSVINLPPGLVSSTDTTATLPSGVTADANAAAKIYGTLPNYIGTWDVTYSVTAGSGTENVMFKINVGDAPEAVKDLAVFPAGPSSLRVTWGAGDDNNAPITSYHLEYRADGGTDADWVPALLPEAIVATRAYTIEGLAPGTYDVRVRAVNGLGNSLWTMAEGSTGAGPGKPTLKVTVDSSIPEDRDRIPVTVTATVPPSASAPRALTVTLTLGVAGKAEERAEIPNTAGISPDLNWVGASATSTKTTLSFTFDSNLESQKTAYLNTHHDDDAEPEKFKISASSKAVPGVFSAGSGSANSMIDDDEEQEYRLQLDDVALESNGMFDEGHGDEPVAMTLMVSPARTLPKSFFVQLVSAQDARDYSLSSGGTSSGGPTAVSLRIDMAAGQSSEALTLTAASNDGDRIDDTITLQMFQTSATSPTTAGEPVGDAVMLTVVDQHKLPKVTMGSIMVDGAAVDTLTEGQTATVTLMADRGDPTDAIPDDETIKVALEHGAASSASDADYSLPSKTVTITGASGTFMLEVLEDNEIDAEELVLEGAVTGEAMYGDSDGAANSMVNVGPISLMDGTTKLVYPKTDEEIQAVIYPAKEAGMGDDMTFNPGETIEIASPGSLFNKADGVTLSFSAMADHDDVAMTSVSGGMVTVTAGDEEGMAHITITAHASMASGAKGLPQTDPSEASIIFPVEVGLEALSFTLMGPEEMNLVEGGMGGMVTATANRAVTADVTINLMRDRAMSTADDMDYTAEAITIEAGMMSGTTMVMATADEMMENEGNMAEELVLYGMAADNAGEVTGQVKFYIWDAAVPALPIIAQLLLAAFLAIGGYRRYRRR